MGVYVKGMEMPERCDGCPMWAGDMNGCPITHYMTIRRKGVDRPEWCPLVPVPEAADTEELRKFWEESEEWKSGPKTE